MATDIDITLDQQESTTREAARSPGPPEPSRGRRGLVVWGGVVASMVAVAALGVAVLRGGDEADDVPATRLAPLSEEIDREAHLEGQRRTYGPPAAPDDGVDAPAEDGFVPGSRRMPQR